MALSSLNMATKGNLDRGAKPTLNNAVDGLLREAGGGPGPGPSGGDNYLIRARRRQRR